MTSDSDALNKVFVKPMSGSAKLKGTLFPWIKRNSSISSRPMSLAAPSDLGVIHDTVFPCDSVSDFETPWDETLGLGWENRRENEWDVSTAADGSEYEPRETMEDVYISLPVKKSRFRKLVPKRKRLSAPPSRQVSATHEPLQEQLKPQDNFVASLRNLMQYSVLLEPLDALIDMFPNHQVLIICLELVVAMWILYQISVLIETFALAIRAICMPLIIVGRIFGYL